MPADTQMTNSGGDVRGPENSNLITPPVPGSDSTPAAMLWDVSALRNFRVAAKDGLFGTVSDMLLEDDQWQVRWLVVDVGTWLSPRKVLIHRSDFGQPDIATHLFPVNLTKWEIESSREISADPPVSHQPLRQGDPGAGAAPQTGDSHLRSAHTVIGYGIQARDGEIGHVTDFIVDDGVWRVRYLLLDTRNWLPSRKVLVPPSAVLGIERLNQVIDIDATRQQIEDSPRYDSEITIDRAYEEIFHAHFGWIGYWM